MKAIKVFFGCIIIINHFGCRDIYKPTIISSPESYLVVEGVLNAGTYNIALNTETLSSGAYFYSLKVNNQKETKKLMVN